MLTKLSCSSSPPASPTRGAAADTGTSPPPIFGVHCRARGATRHPGAESDDRAGAAPQRSKGSGACPRSRSPRAAPACWGRGGGRAAAVEWPPPQPMGAQARALAPPPARRTHFAHFGVAHGDDFDAQGLAGLLPLRHGGLHGPRSLGAARLGVCGLRRPARPSGAVGQWQKRGSRHRPRTAAVHPRRGLAAGPTVGGAQGRRRVSRC